MALHKHTQQLKPVIIIISTSSHRLKNHNRNQMCEFYGKMSINNAR